MKKLLGWFVYGNGLMNYVNGTPDYYMVSPLGDGWSAWKWAPSAVCGRDNLVKANSGGALSLQEAMNWCERDANAAEVAANKDDNRRKFPESMDPKEWEAGFLKARSVMNCPPGVPSSAEAWFSAAMARGREEGKKEAEARVKHLEDMLRVANGTIQCHYDRAEAALRYLAPKSPGNGEYEEAKRLAEFMHKEFYGGEPKEREPLPTLIGVLSQIDNMLAGMRPKGPAPKSPGPKGFKCPQCGTANCWGTTDWPGEPMKGHCHGRLSDGSRCKFEWVRSDERDLELGITNEAPEFYTTGCLPQPSAQEPVAPEMSAPVSSGKHPLVRLKERIDQVNESFDDFRVDKQKQLAALADQGRMHEKNIDALDAGLVALKSVVAQLKIDFLRGLKLANERIGVLESKSGGDWSKRLAAIEAELPRLSRLEDLVQALVDSGCRSE